MNKVIKNLNLKEGETLSSWLLQSRMTAEDLEQVALTKVKLKQFIRNDLGNNVEARFMEKKKSIGCCCI